MTIIQKYYQMKEKHAGWLLLFRCGEFYECYEEDAKDASQILGITLTRRQRGVFAKINMAGFPRHALDTYLPKLIRAGNKIAIVEDFEPIEKVSPFKANSNE